MDVFRAGGEHLRTLHPFVFSESGVNNFVGVFDRASSRDIYGGGHFQNYVGLRNIPTARPVQRRRCIARIACRSTGGGPGTNRADILSGERGVVGEMAETRVGKPGRHFARGDFVGDAGGLATRMVEGLKGHGANTSGAVASLAMLLEDGQDISIESGRA